MQLPPSVFKPRRTNAHYLAFIEVITFYHQYQREQKKDESTGEVYIETTVADIKAANQLMSEVLLRKSDEIPGACRNYYEALKHHLQQQQKDSFTNRMISKELHMPISTVKRHNFMLFQAGYLTKLPGAGENKEFTYTITDQQEYQQMKNNITTVLDTILSNIQANKQQVTSSPSAQTPTEPLKPRPAKGKEQQAAGFVSKQGEIVLADGNHKMNAALQYAIETGDKKYVDAVINYGNFNRGIDLAAYGIKIYRCQL